MKRGLAAMLVLALSGVARADDAPPVGRAAIQQDLLGYYGGERASAYFVLVYGTLAAGTGGYLVTRKEDFSRGMGWPLLGLGVLEVAGGISYALRVGSEIDHYSAALAADPAAFQAEESAHIQGTTSRFFYYRMSELALAVGGVGAATYGFAANKDAWKGAGIGCAAIGTPFFIMDTINNDRAGDYLAHLKRFDPKLALQLDGSGARLSLAARF